MSSRHNGGWTVVFLDRRSDARDFLADGGRPAISAKRFHRYARSAHPQADAESVDRASGRSPAAATIQVRLLDSVRANCRGRFDPVRSGSGIDPRPAQDPRHDRDELAVVSRIQRAIGLLHASDVVSLRDPRGARRHRQRGARQGLKMPPCDPRDPSVIPHDAQPYLEACAGDEVGFGGTDLPRRQRASRSRVSGVKAFSSEVGTVSREENASEQNQRFGSDSIRTEPLASPASPD